MSGFAAIVPPSGEPVDAAVVERMAAFLSFRGPDGTRTLAVDGCGLAFSLLRTGDRPEPAGPFSLDASLHVVCDARLDARPELLRALRDAGEGAELDASAAELLARAYRAWGRDCVHHLVGDFAFAVWDRSRRRLFCARDPLGIKLLYHASPLGAVVCSNTLECVRLHPGAGDELDEVAVGDFLVRSVQLDRDRTIRRDVRVLPPGHTLTAEDGRARIEPYWRWPDDPPLRYRRVGDYVEHFIDLFATAVRARTPPSGVGVMMSGGLDSTSVAALSIAAVDAGPGVRAFTAHSSGLLREEEGRYAAIAAEALGIPVTWLDVDGYRAFARFGGDPLLERPEPLDAPFLAGQVDQWVQAAGHARVLLTGFGGDAVLRETPSRLTRLAAGGHLLRAAAEAVQYARLHRRVPRPGVRTWLRRGDPPVPTVIPEWIDPEFARRVELRERMETHRTPAPSAHPRHPEALEMLAEPLWTNLFASLDPGATRLPLEIRHPLFDVRLIRFLLSIPPAQWYNDKGLLRIGMKGRLPDAVLRRPKSPLPHDPLEARRRAHGEDWLGGRRLGPEVEPWVDVARVPAATGGRAPGDGQPLWRNLRPLSLSVWLHGGGGA